MRLHSLHHVPFEGLGLIEDWAKSRRISVTSTELWKNPALPLPHEVDWLVVMGGPMSVHDEDKHPWLKREKAFIRDFIRLKRPVLGVCLGAQLISEVLGGNVTRNPETEAGWLPVTEAHPDLPLPWPAEVEVFHWHQETFSLPPHAKRICSSKGCLNQGFIWGDRVIGLQFHLEMTPSALESLITHCATELPDGLFVQTPDAMKQGLERNADAMAYLLGVVLQYLSDKATS